MAESQRRKNEDLERMLRRFSRQVKNEGIIDNVRSRERYEKPSEVRKRNDELARRRTLAKQREEDF